MTRLRRAGLAVACVTAGLFLFWLLASWSDPRLPADEAAKRLRATLGVEWTFVCTEEGRDETIPANIDYICQPSRVNEVGYWIETDESSITIVGHTG